MRFLFLFFTLGSALLFSATVAQMKNEKRYAFVIANGVTSETGEDKVVAAAMDMESFLKTKGFETASAYNLDRAALIKKFRTFEKKLEPNAAVVLVYGGRVVTYDGQTWMLPAAMNLEGLNQLRLAAVSFNFLLTKAQTHRPRITIGLIDAYAYSATKNETDAEQMISSMKGIKEKDILVQWNGKTQSSDFFARMVKTVGNEEDDIVVIAEKMEGTGTGQAIAQEDFYFNVPNTIMTPTDKAWQRAEKKNTPVSYEAFLIAFPDSKYKKTAEERIAAMTAKKQPVTTVQASGAVAATGAVAVKSAQATVSEGDKPVFYEPAEMVSIPEGVFLMGSEQFENAQPVHMVKVEKPFKMSAFEVSNKEYGAYVKATGVQYRNKKLLQNESAAVAYVSWDDAKAYAAWLSQVSGKHYRLPTEAEWEYAARGGSNTPYAWGENAALAPQFAWMALNAHGFVHSRGLLQPNGYGLFDMAGNVAEWCLDAALPDYKGAPSVSDRAIVDQDAMKIIRGGSYKSSAESLSPYYRESNIPMYRSDTVGFRLVESL